MKEKKRFHYLVYFEDERLIGIKIEVLKVVNNSVRKNLTNIKNVKDNIV